MRSPDNVEGKSERKKISISMPLFIDSDISGETSLTIGRNIVHFGRITVGRIDFQAKRPASPSHTLQCPAVATVCPVKECGQSTRRGQVRSHIKDTQMCHFAMLQSERESILWKFDEIVRSV